MKCESALDLPGKQELIDAALGREECRFFLGDNLRQKHLAILMLTMAVNKPSLYLHSHRVRMLSRHLTGVLHLSKGQAAMIELGALLHDIGKLAIPTSILQKAASLTHRELMHIRRHPAYGAVMLKQMGISSQVTNVVYHHHEHWNGEGYPDGIKEEEIPLGARIVAIADAFEAMTSYRPYQAPFLPIQALEELCKCASTQFDPILVDHFCSSMEVDPLVLVFH